jgi:hypothetical protein
VKTMGTIARLNSFKNSFLGMRLKELRYRFAYGRKNSKMMQARKRFSDCKDKKTRIQIHQEISLCQKFWKCYPLHYFRYNLYRNDCLLTDGELIDFIPDFFFYQLFLAHYDSRKYLILLADKVIVEQIFRSLGIAHPPTLAKLVKSRLWSENMKPVKFRELGEILAENGPHKIFVKPVDGMGGYGIVVFHRQENGCFKSADGLMLDEDFLSRIGQRNDYIIQCGLEQDRQLSQIYPHSVNTFRIVTANLSGDVRILLSTLRIGRSGREVDNSAQNNIVLPIDVVSGNTAAFGCTEAGEKFTHHPDTGFFFKGTHIQHWKEVREFTVTSAQKLPQFTYLGWDIGLTRDGPVAIETNLNFGLDHYQAVLGGVRKVFGIEDPSFYWRNRGMR